MKKSDLLLTADEIKELAGCVCVLAVMSLLVSAALILARVAIGFVLTGNLP